MSVSLVWFLRNQKVWFWIFLFGYGAGLLLGCMAVIIGTEHLTGPDLTVFSVQMLLLCGVSVASLCSIALWVLYKGYCLTRAKATQP